MKNYFIDKIDVLEEPLTVNVKTAAGMLCVSERTIRTLTKNGELPVVRIGSRAVYSREDLVEFVRQRSSRVLINSPFDESIDDAPDTDSHFDDGWSDYYDNYDDRIDFHVD